MSQHTLVYNGKIAKSWATENLAKIADVSIRTTLEKLSIQEEPRAELREVIHQEYGQVNYFNIEICPQGQPKSYIRGYALPDRSIRDLRKCSSAEFAVADERTRQFLGVVLQSALNEMLPSFGGRKILSSHLDSENPAPLTLPNQDDWETLRQMVINNPYIDRLSSAFLDCLDLHPAQSK